MTARKTGLAIAAWLFPYFLPRQPNKLNYKPVNPIKKKIKSTELSLNLLYLSRMRKVRKP